MPLRLEISTTWLHYIKYLGAADGVPPIHRTLTVLHRHLVQLDQLAPARASFARPPHSRGQDETCCTRRARNYLVLTFPHIHGWCMIRRTMLSEPTTAPSWYSLLVSSPSPVSSLRATTNHSDMRAPSQARQHYTPEPLRPRPVIPYPRRCVRELDTPAPCGLRRSEQDIAAPSPIWVACSHGSNNVSSAISL